MATETATLILRQYNGLWRQPKSVSHTFRVRGLFNYDYWSFFFPHNLSIRSTFIDTCVHLRFKKASNNSTPLKKNETFFANQRKKNMESREFYAGFRGNSWPCRHLKEKKMRFFRCVRPFFPRKINLHFFINCHRNKWGWATMNKQAYCYGIIQFHWGCCCFLVGIFNKYPSQLILSAIQTNQFH